MSGGNPYHDERGQFTDGPSSGGGGGMGFIGEFKTKNEAVEAVVTKSKKQVTLLKKKKRSKDKLQEPPTP